MYVDAEYANEETVAGGFFFSDGGQITVNGSGWCSHPPCTPPSGLSITSPPLAPLTILHPPHPTPSHPTHRHRVSAAITYRITSRRKVDFPTGHLSEAITAGGQDEVKWHDLWERWKGRGHKCIANLRDVPIEAAGPERLAWLWRRCWNRARPSAP